MKVAVFSCSENEKAFYTGSASDNIQFRFFAKDLTINTLGLAEGFNTIIIPCPDCLTKLVLQQLHRLQIQYIIFYVQGKTDAPIEKTKTLNMKQAYIPDNKYINEDKLLINNYLSSFTFTNDVGKLVIETLNDWKNGKKSRFEL